MLRLTRPVLARDLFDSPEMTLRYPDEIERRRDGTDEGAGRGFDYADLSAGVDRTIATPAKASDVIAWFAERLGSLGWHARRDGGFRRGEFETFSVRVEFDRGVSRLASTIHDNEGRRLQVEFERLHYGGAPEGWSVLTAFYVVAPEIKSAVFE